MKLESYLRWLSIALFTALAVLVTVAVLGMVQSPMLRRINPFYLYLAADVILWFIVIRFVLQEFYVRGQLFGKVKWFYEYILAHPIQRLYGLAVRDRHSLNSRFVLIGFYIFVALTVLFLTNVLDNRALLPLQTFFFGGSYRVPPERNESSVVTISLLTRDNNQKEYFEACLKIARDLKKAGARVMLMDLPELPGIGLYHNLVLELQQTGIVVFATRPLDAPSYLPTRLQRTIRYSPFGRKTMNDIDISWGHYTYEFHEFSLSHAIDRFVPYDYRDPFTGDKVPDAALQVLRKYSYNSAIEQRKNEVSIGGFHLPVSDDGYLYSSRPYDYRFPKNVAILYLWEKPEISKAPYTIHKWNPEKPEASTQTVQNLEGLEDQLRDKIVMIWWQDQGSYNAPHGARLLAYSALFNNILTENNILRKSEGWPLFLTFFSVVGCGLLARFLRGLYAVPLMLLFGVGLFFATIWLLQSQSILVDFTFPLVAVILSIAVFPLARFAWTMRAVSPLSAASFIPEPMTQPEVHTAGSGLFELTGKKLSLSLPIAAIVLLTAIVGSVLLTSLLQQPEIQKEPVYIMSMPTVEVQGYYSPSNGSAQ